jgi:hypothetical protein
VDWVGVREVRWMDGVEDLWKGGGEGRQGKGIDVLVNEQHYQREVIRKEIKKGKDHGQ